MEKRRARLESNAAKQVEPKLTLGQCVVHWKDGWTGVVYGMQQEEREKKVKDVEEKTASVVKEAVYCYHVLPSAQYWPKRREGGPCVAFVEVTSFEERLCGICTDSFVL